MAQFNIMIVGQAGRLEYEALLFVASLREMSPKFRGKMIVVEPQPGDRWGGDTRISEPVRAQLAAMGAEIRGFQNHHFGEYYPYGNKIEGLAVMPEGEPFVFGYTAVWKSLYDKFDLDFESSLDTSQPDDYWQRYLYFNAGWFFGACPVAFGKRFVDWAVAVRDDMPDELVLCARKRSCGERDGTGGGAQ